ncbi:MAG: hypothetical protein CMH83_10910 [Nocardioides sp.]|nr:hypothetical protein [Nocardioides sp.]
MSANGIRVNHAAMVECVDRMRTAVKEQRRHRQQFIDDMAPLAEQWQGEAGQRWERVKQRWDGIVNDMDLFLQRAATSVEESHGEYIRVDKKTAGYWDGLD